MDSLLNELGGDSLGLNIVCETAPASNKPAKTRRKKNNKYEKRRAKARRANGEKAPGDIQNDKTSDAAVAKHGEVKDDAKRIDSGKGDADADADVQATPEDVVPVEDVSNLVSQAMQGEEKISEKRIIYGYSERIWSCISRRSFRFLCFTWYFGFTCLYANELHVIDFPS